MAHLCADGAAPLFVISPWNCDSTMWNLETPIIWFEKPSELE